MASRLTLLTLLACALLALTAGGAQAVIVTVGKHRLSYEPLPGAVAPGAAKPNGKTGSQAKPLSKKNMTYHNGPVMPSNANYAIYWDPAGGASYPAGYQSGINTYFEDIAHDSGGLLNTDSVLTQYGDKSGEFANYASQFGGALLDTNPYPANGCSSAPICLTDEQLRAELAAFVQAKALPTDLKHMYFLVTPKGVESCFEAIGHSCSAGAAHASYCAYHSYINVGNKGAVLVYANDPFVGGLGCADEANRPNGNPSDEAIGGGLAHEHAEAVTDPQLNAWYDSKGFESGDKCRTFNATTEFGPPLGKAPNGSNYNQVINSHRYWYQQEWSNELGECSQRQLQVPAIKKLSPKSGPAAGGTTVTITGSGFTASSSVAFGEAPAGGVVFNSSTSLTAVSPSGSVGTVDVRVTTAGGTSAIVKKDHFKYKK